MIGAALQLGRGDHEAEPICASSQPAVYGHEAAVFGLRQRHVLGVVGLRPAEFLGDFPCRHGVAVRALLADRQLPGQEALQGQLSESVGDVAAKGHLMKHRRNLAPQQRRRDELPSVVQTGARLLSGPVKRQLDDQARVYDQHVQWDSRERRTAAATFGIGSPVNVSPQPAGSGAISGSSAGSSGMTIRARAALASSRSSTSRSNFSFAVTVQAYRPPPRNSEERNP